MTTEQVKQPTAGVLKPSKPKVTPAATVPEALDRVKNLKDWLNGIYTERHDLVDMMMVALVAREHAVLIGTPGIAKSAIIKSLMDALNVDTMFEYLLTKFSEPNEVFGPVNLQKILAKEGESSQYVRVVTGRLPTAQLAFLDEAFKANSAILNALLTILNERKFDNGGERLDVPLHSAFLASNELPEEDKKANLGALWDRCLLRIKVQPVDDPVNWDKMVFNRPIRTPPPAICLADFQLLHEYSKKLGFDQRVRAAAKKIDDELKKKDIFTSDRRWMKTAQQILVAAAALDGASQVEEEHLKVLKYVLWNKEEQIPVVELLVKDFGPAWKREADEMAMKLKEAENRLTAAQNMTGGNRLRALADLADLMEAIGSEATDIHKRHKKKETGDLVQRAESIAKSALDAARRTKPNA